MKKEQSLHTFRWIYNSAKGILFPLAIMVALCAALSFVSVGFALASRSVIDTATGQLAGSLMESCLNLVLLIVLQLALQVVISRLEVVLSGKLEIRLKENLFCKLLRKDWQAVSRYHSGELLNRITSDVNVIVGGVTTIAPDFVSMLVRIITSFVVLFMLAPVLSVCILALGPVIVIFGRIYSRRVKLLHKQCQESDGVTRSYMQEMLQNIIVVKSFGNEEKVAERSHDLQLTNYRLKLKRNAISILANVCLFLIFTAGYYVTLGWGAFQLSAGLLSFGTLTAMLQLVSQIQTPFRNMSGLLTKTFSMFASAERIMELEAMEQEEQDHDYSAKYPLISQLVVDKVTFAYQDTDILCKSSLTVKKGEFVAIAGMSGIGKSTLLKLMIGLIKPDEGEIYFTCEGKKISAGADTRSYFSYVPQGNMILSGSIRDNIRFYRDGISDGEIERCAAIAQMKDFVDALPDGLDTVLKEGGEGLSEGQIQRIAIARALLRDAPMLLLDEATSALDEATERAVLEQLKALTDKSCIIVSHKKAAFEVCDKVVRIENGRILEDTPYRDSSRLAEKPQR